MIPWNDAPNIVQRATRRLIAARPATWLLARLMHRLDGGPERAAAWARAVALYPGYREYAARAGREIAVVALERTNE